MFSIEKNYLKEQNELIQSMCKDFGSNKKEIEKLKQELQEYQKKMSQQHNEPNSKNDFQEKPESPNIAVEEEDRLNIDIESVNVEEPASDLEDDDEDRLNIDIESVSVEEPSSDLDEEEEDRLNIDIESVNVEEPSSDPEEDDEERLNIDIESVNVEEPASDLEKDDEERLNIDVPAIYKAYIPETILPHLEELNPDEYFHGKRKFVTILKTEIEEINLLSKQLAPEAYVKLYNKLFNQTFSSIYNHNGIINQYGGESFLAVFGLFDDDHKVSAQNAFECAKELSRKINFFTEYLEEKSLNPISLSIGIHSGDVIVGKVGVIKQKEMLIMGDDVKIAESVCSLSKKHEFNIMISEKTNELLAEDIVNEAENLSPPGLKKKLKIYKP